MQFNTTQYYLISPISRVEEFIEEIENYRQINKDLPSQNSKQAVFIIILSNIKQKKKKENIIQRLQPSFPLGKSRLTPRQVISPSIFIRRNRNARPTFHSHHGFLKITSDQSADHQSNQRNCWRARGRNTRARAHTEIGSYRFVSIGGQTRIDPVRDSETPPRIGVWGLATALFASNVAIKYP